MPSMHACSALIGSISVIMTRAPAPRIAAALPLPTSPKPQISARLPPSITSVARMMPSGREWRQPYTLSNFDFVTQSFTLMAGNRSSPLAAICFRRCTPVVVSSETPRTVLLILVHFCASFRMDAFRIESTHLNSGFSVDARPREHLLRAPPVLLERLALPREHGGGPGLGDRRGRVVLRREDVAARPAHLRAKRVERLDQHAGLDGHVKGAGDPDALERLVLALRAAVHQARHLHLRQDELLAAELRKAHVSHLRISHLCNERRAHK